MTDYHPVTKEELDQIKNDCVHPETDSCDGCEFDSFEPPICRFIGANALMDEVLSRPDPLEILEAWRKHQFLNTPDISYPTLWAMEAEIIAQLRTNPDAVIARGKDDGWLND